MARNTRSKQKSSLLLPQQLERQGQALFDRQMWCWGCDVRHPAGNCLIAYGFHKQASPDPRFNSVYYLPLSDICSISLWGFGLWLAHDALGTLFLRRGQFRPAYLPEAKHKPQAWQADDLPSMPYSTNAEAQQAAASLLSQALAWITQYEVWLTHQGESFHRQSTLASWPLQNRHACLKPVDNLSTWAQFAEALEQFRTCSRIAAQPRST